MVDLETASDLEARKMIQNRIPFMTMSGSRMWFYLYNKDNSPQDLLGSFSEGCKEIVFCKVFGCANMMIDTEYMSVEDGKSFGDTVLEIATIVGRKYSSLKCI